MIYLYKQSLSSNFKTR